MRTLSLVALAAALLFSFSGCAQVPNIDKRLKATQESKPQPEVTIGLPTALDNLINRGGIFNQK